MAKKPKLKTRKLPPCGPVDVPAVWKRIEAAVAALAPELLGNLEEGATTKEINAFEKAIGRKLPKEVRQSFRAHNGERTEGPSIVAGLPFGSLAWASYEWSSWTMYQGREHLELPISELKLLYGSEPKNAIQLRYANRDWIQLLDLADGNYFGLDFSPGPQGVSGQVINFGRNENHKKVWAWSWGWFLNDLAEELEAGNFRYDSDYRGLLIIEPAPEHGWFNHISEWSKAKTAGRRPFDPLADDVLAPLQANSNVTALARTIAKNRDFGALPILADALEEAGCTDKPLLAHCRKPGEHGCGCWAVNLLLGEAPEFVATSAAQAE
jgi:cell wall assembly regulator SMI1